MIKVTNKSFDKEREFYEVDGLHLIDCKFDGICDGESAMKESKNIVATSCYFNLRYPFWHSTNVDINSCDFTVNCRAPFWYTDNIQIKSSNLECVKALRECTHTKISNSKISSVEFGWLCQDVCLENCDISGEYLLLNSKDISLNNVKLEGKYSFQYVNGGNIKSCVLNTKDAFWHSKDLYVKDSVINGEYLGWYSENLTLENCIIKGTQPLCYCKGLKLINCQMIDCDLAFERSEVCAEITTSIESVKNPLSGYISAPCVDNYIKDYPDFDCKVYSGGVLL